MIESSSKIFTNLGYIDLHLKDQKASDGICLSATKSPNPQDEVSQSLKQLGWMKDSAILDIMTAYRLDNILNENSHLTLCDLVENRPTRMVLLTS